MLLAVLMVGETSANSGGVPETSAEIVTYEVAPKEIVTREVAPNEVVVKEISPQEVAKRKRASKEAARQQVTRLEGTSGEIPDLATFLDRLMLAESSGRDTAANPLSTALGPFQFIKSTFLDIARRHFPQYYADLSDEQVLALRTTRHFARAAAAAYTLENAAHLKGEGHEPSWPHLRLAFLLGPVGASRVLQAAPDTPLSQVLGASVLQANPFMNGIDGDRVGRQGSPGHWRRGACSCGPRRNRRPASTRSASAPLRPPASGYACCFGHAQQRRRSRDQDQVQPVVDELPALDCTAAAQASADAQCTRRRDQAQEKLDYTPKCRCMRSGLACNSAGLPANAI